MRVVKEAEERKNEILDAAERLFVIKGFDHTSTNDILEAVGIARGTLYYHFKSKEEILDGMIARITHNLLARASGIVNNKELTVLQRLPLVLMSLNMENDLGEEILRQVHKPQNALLHQKLQEQLIKGVNPLITRLCEEGIEQGVCHTDYPADTVEMIMLYATTAFDDLTDDTEEIRQRKIDAFIYNLERLLGMERGQMQEIMVPVFTQDTASTK